jgi:hypothetical protein
VPASPHSILQPGHLLQILGSMHEVMSETGGTVLDIHCCVKAIEHRAISRRRRRVFCSNKWFSFVEQVVLLFCLHVY